MTAATQATATPTILVVEDEQIVALDLSEVLEGLGYQVVGLAATGEQAIAVATRTAPDVVLMDVHLAGVLDGIKTADRLSGLDGPAIVYVTAFDDARTLGRARVTEPYGYLVKPFNARELRAAIEMAVYHRKMQRERAVLTQRLRDALAEITHLQELLRMCAYCRRLATDDGRWLPVEQFLLDHTGTSVSHGMCPDCLASLMPPEDEDPAGD